MFSRISTFFRLFHFIYKFFDLKCTYHYSMSDNNRSFVCFFLLWFQIKWHFFALKRFIVDLSQCRMQYAINVCMRFIFRFFGNVSRLWQLSRSLCSCNSSSRSASSKRSATEVKHMHIKIIAACVCAFVCATPHFNVIPIKKFHFFPGRTPTFFTFFLKKKKNNMKKHTWKKIEMQL